MLCPPVLCGALPLTLASTGGGGLLLWPPPGSRVPEERLRGRQLEPESRGLSRRTPASASLSLCFRGSEAGSARGLSPGGSFCLAGLLYPTDPRPPSASPEPSVPVGLGFAVPRSIAKGRPCVPPSSPLLQAPPTRLPSAFPGLSWPPSSPLPQAWGPSNVTAASDNLTLALCCSQSHPPGRRRHPQPASRGRWEPESSVWVLMV